MLTRPFLVACLLLVGPLYADPALAAGYSPPRVMLATSHAQGVRAADYWVSEKLDGVRGRWNGRALYTRAGNRIEVPAWFTKGWPATPMDGELWMGRGRFDEVSALVRTGFAGEPGWQRVRFMVFDLPEHGGTFDARVVSIRADLGTAGVAWLQPVPQFRIANTIELDERLRRVVADGGEGLMLHRRTALYRVGRSDDLVKYKLHDDAEARVVAHTPGKGKYAGMLGALVVELPDGRRLRLGSGLSDAQRAAPPAVGSLVTYRYSGLTSTGLPRFARFLRVRHDPAPPDPR